MDLDAIGTLLDHQEGVISRRQVLDRGGDDNDIERLLRRRVWARVHPGVYLEHTGPPTVPQREWAAVLVAAPAALSGWSALRRHGVRSGTEGSHVDEAVEIAIDHTRIVTPPAGVRVVRMRGFADRVQDHLSPPRVRVEDAVLDVAAASDELGAVAILADACRSRRTTAGRLSKALAARPRMRHRSLLRRVLADVEAGTQSVLEWLYLTRVERPHGLPGARRQRTIRVGRRSSHRDVEYLTARTIVELDGRLGHDLAADRWSDLARDVDAAADGALSVRLGWRQVLEPCRTAAAITRILIARGATVAATPCSATCSMYQWVSPPA